MMKGKGKIMMNKIRTSIICMATIAVMLFGTMVPVAASETQTSQISIQSAAAMEDGYRDVSAAYKALNVLRTRKAVWYWKEDNKTRKYFNTNSRNKLRKATRDAALEKTARLRAKECAVRFSHTRPDGRAWFTAYPDGYMYMGENLAYGFTSTKAVTAAWREYNNKYERQGHRRNMLNKNFTKVGIACYVKDGVCYWAQCLGQ